MKLTEEQQKICDKYSARDEEGFVHCHECPLAINHTYHLCLKVATRHDLKEYGMAVWMSREEIALEEAEKMLRFGATDKEKVLARVAIEAIGKQIPRKPRYEDGDYYCKECGAKLETYLYSRCVSYCSSCGSAHDWNDCK